MLPENYAKSTELCAPFFFFSFGGCLARRYERAYGRLNDNLVEPPFVPAVSYLSSPAPAQFGRSPKLPFPPSYCSMICVGWARPRFQRGDARLPRKHPCWADLYGCIAPDLIGGVGFDSTRARGCHWISWARLLVRRTVARNPRKAFGARNKATVLPSERASVARPGAFQAARAAHVDMACHYRVRIAPAATLFAEPSVWCRARKKSGGGAGAMS